MPRFSDTIDCPPNHVQALLRAERPCPRPNRRFRFGNREDSPVRQYARRRFRESIRSMVMEVYRPVRMLPEEVV